MRLKVIPWAEVLSPQVHCVPTTPALVPLCLLTYTPLPSVAIHQMDSRMLVECPECLQRVEGTPGCTELFVFLHWPPIGYF